MAEKPVDYISVHIEKFDGKNFQMILEDKDLWGIVCSEAVEPADNVPAAASIPKFQKRERKVYATICLS